MSSAAYDVRSMLVADVMQAQGADGQSGIVLVAPGNRAQSLSLRIGPASLPAGVYLAFRVGASGAPVIVRAGDAFLLHDTPKGVFACFATDAGTDVTATFTAAQTQQAIQFFIGL